MKKKREERRRLRRLKIRTIFMLSITLIFNAYAWFLYITTVSVNITVHVESWNIDFRSDDQQVEREVTFNVTEAYPGMEDETKEVTITNSGEKSADINYTFIRARIINTEYVVYDELSDEEKLELTGNEIKTTSEELEKMLKEEFPFKLEVEKGDDILNVSKSSTVKFSFSWDYEGASDENDTKYGVDSYEYYKNNNGDAAIQIIIKISVRQSNTNVSEAT